MELVSNQINIDSFKHLSENPLFWFFKNMDFEHVQHDLRSMTFDFGSAYLETLSSNVSKKMNEDSPLVLSMGEDRTLFAVFDGASSQKKISCLDSEGISGAFYISHMVSNGFETTPQYSELCQKPELTAKDVMIAMNKWIYTKIIDIPGVDYSDMPSVPGMAAALLLVDQPNKILTIAQVADSTISSVDNHGNVKILIPNLNEKFDQETMAYVFELANKYNLKIPQLRQFPETKELIRAHIADSNSKKTNRKGGCGIMNGMPEMVSNNLIYSDTFSMNDDISSIFIFSDGAILPFIRKDVSLETSTESLIDSVERRNGSSALYTGASILENDPDFTMIPRLKLKDDSTVIEVTFNTTSGYTQYV